MPRWHTSKARGLFLSAGCLIWLVIMALAVLVAILEPRLFRPSHRPL